MYYVELRFPKNDLIDVVKRKDKEALFKLVMESLENYMEENV